MPKKVIRGKPKITVTKQTVKAPAKKSYLERIEEEVNTNQSKLNLILGALILLVIGVLVFNYFNKNKAGETQSQNTSNQQQTGDVSPDNLPGKYTIKEGDTLFAIADKYYKDGYKYPEIVKANNITNPDSVEVGKTIDIPKVEITATQTPSASENQTTPTATPTDSNWGPAITGDKYTVQPGDWLSTISARAYGDVMSFDKIAKANNITDPNVIEPDTVLTIPR